MNTSWLTYLNLEEELKECFNYVYFNDSDSQQRVYSNKFADILLRASIEIETLIKELYRRNGGTKRTDKIKFDAECLGYLDSLFDISKKVVFVAYPFFDFKNEKNKAIYPLSHFSMTDSNEWNKSYQDIKHDKLKNYKKGNLRVALHSLAALFLLNVYFKDEEFTIKHGEVNTFDNRFGSSLFSLNKPSDKTGFFSNAYISNESVYEYRLTDASQEEFKKQHSDYMQRFMSYVSTVPEMHETDFSLIVEGITKQFSGVSLVMNYFNALAKYRVDKLFCGLSKDEKYKLLESKTGKQINDENYEENYFILILKEEQDYIHLFPPLFLHHALSDSLVRIFIPRINNDAN